MSRSRNFCFTLNNYTNDNESFLECLVAEGKARYICFGREVAPSTGTPHLQGFVSWKDPKSFSACRASLPQRCAVFECKGTASQNRIYCSKGSDFVEFGSIPKDPKQVGEFNSDRYKQFIEAAKTGNEEEVDPKLFVQYYSTFQRIKQAHAAYPDNLVHVCGIWIHGKPGTGKSHSVATRFPDCYRKMANKWWDGYQGQDVVWLDDLDPDSASWCPRFLKIWADKWSFQAEVKGGTLMIRPKVFIVTSNYSIDQMGFRKEDREAIARRFCEIEKFASQSIIL